MKIKLSVNRYHSLAIKISNKIQFDLEKTKIELMFLKIKGYIFLVLLIHIPITLLSQKPALDVNSYKSWTSVSEGGISNDGEFIFYTINSEASDSSTLILKQIKNNWQEGFANVSNPKISQDCKYFVGTYSNDSILIMNLDSKQKRYIRGRQGELYNNTAGNYLVFTNTKHQLIIKSLEQQKEITYDSVQEFKVNPEFNSIIFKQFVDEHGTSNVCWVDVKTGLLKTIFSGANVTNLIIDRIGKGGAFFADYNGAQGIWSYIDNEQGAQLLVTNKSHGLDENITLDPLNFKYSKDGESLFFSVRNSSTIKEKLNKTKPRIWNFEDQYLQTLYFNPYGQKSSTYLSIVNIKNKIVQQLLHNSEIIANNTFENDNDSLLIIETYNSDPEDQTNKIKSTDYSICYTRSGAREFLMKNKQIKINNIKISPNNLYVAFYDPEEINYFTYTLSNKILTNISKCIKENLFRNHLKGYPNRDRLPAGIIGWFNEGESVLVKSEFDIWSLDPSGKEAPKNLTSKIGQQTNIIFNLALEEYKRKLHRGESIILTGLNLETKSISLYKLDFGRGDRLTKLSEGAYYIYPMENLYFEMQPSHFVKAKNTNSFLMLRQTSQVAPNYYYTKDLKTFTKESNVHSQEKYNWLTTELISYKDTSNQICQAIIYKPENFDPNKKYPIVFNYYTEKSNLLNRYPSVEPVGAEFNIPVAVSNGYIVCLPDIKISVGKPGEGALNSVLGFVDYLSQYSWADTSKMAIVGHSFGGFETNYIITHSTIFKAAISGAGVSDFISMAYELWEVDGQSKQYYYQYAVPRMGNSMASSPSIYIENSPMLNIKNVSTPLLLLHNSDDSAVPVRQTRQFFIALRSLGKRVWWINYEGEGHQLIQEDNKIDYTKKSLEFLNYLLQNKGCPKWMSNYLRAEYQ